MSDADAPELRVDPQYSICERLNALCDQTLDVNEDAMKARQQVAVPAEWTAQQLREAFPFDEVPHYLVWAEN